MNDKIVVFGGSGYLGAALIDRLIKMGRTNILAVARNEGNLVALKEKFPIIQIMVGDISDRWIVKKAMKDAGEVYLLSALKHVTLAELDVKACVNTNIVGCENIITESLSTKPKVLVFISSDKAAQPTGVYGCTKKIGERLMAEAETINPDTKYRTIRYGNVWGSTGSLITKWRPKMEKGEEIILTDPEASRFFWTVEESVDLIFEAIKKAKDATPYIPKMKAVKMGVVLEACMEVYGQCPVKIIGLQPGENKIETTDGVTFSDKVEQFSKNEFIEKFLKRGLLTAAEPYITKINETWHKLQKHITSKITAVLITRENEYPAMILERLNTDFFDEILIFQNSPSVYSRYLTASTAKNDIIYVQDDDCMVNYQVLFKHYNGQITNTMTLPFKPRYDEMGCTLVGWGTFFPKSMLGVFDKYIERYGENDPHLLREADRIFTYLNKPFNTIIMPHEDLPTAGGGDRMGVEPNHFPSAEEALRKVSLL
jgi:nucleoside-diphosphate-sugar epimerase